MIRVLRIRRALEAPDDFDSYLRLTHETGDAMASTVLHRPLRPTGDTVPHSSDDWPHKYHEFVNTPADFPRSTDSSTAPPPALPSSSNQLQDPIEDSYRELRLLRLDKLIPHHDSWEKKALVFWISRSIHIRSTS